MKNKYSKRDNFSVKIKETLAKRCGTLCSNPDCCVLTYGPQMNPDKSINIGVAAHIEGASPGSARYNPNQTKQKRSSIDNGIWLCQNCAKMIDNDEKKYSVEFLMNWKKQAEARAKEALGNKKILSSSIYKPESIVVITRQKHITYPKTEFKKNGMCWAPIRIVPLKTNRDLFNPEIPVRLSKCPLPKGTNLLHILYQNQGNIIDEKIKIDLNFNEPAIISFDIDIKNRVQVIGGGKGSSYISFYVKESLPKEIQHISLISKADIIPDTTFWTKNQNKSEDIFVFDIVYDT